MKICIVTPAVVKGDGQGRANYEIILEAVRRGHAVTILACEVASELQAHPLISYIPFKPALLRPQLLKEIHFSFFSSKWLWKNRHLFDLVQSYGSVTSAKSDINTVQFVHNAWLNSPAHTLRVRRDMYGIYQWIYNWLNAQWEKSCFSNSDKIIAVSEKIRQELINIGVPFEKTEVILNGVDLSSFSPGNIDCNDLGIPKKTTIALFAGDIRTNRKNLDSVLHALISVPNLHLAVVGSTERSPYPQMVKSLQLENRVHFLGFRHDVNKLMQAVDLFVFPSRYEACTLVLLEAMASGLPVITAATAGGAEIVTPECGFVLPDPDDIELLVGSLNYLVNNPQIRKQMGSNAYLIALQHSWEEKARTYIDLFEQYIFSKSTANCIPS